MKVLFLSDSHLGFDLPVRPRVRRRRRGDDFFLNYERALKPALQKKVDVVVHGGDLFFRSRVPPSLVQKAFDPLKKLAGQGVPVFIVPGNHERSQMPRPLLVQQPGIQIFDRPRTFIVKLKNLTLSLAGFPFVRNDIRGKFSDLVRQTGAEVSSADFRLLCIHQAVEGARVGSGYTFRYGPDVIRGAEIPAHFVAVLAGHLHRSQVLWNTLIGTPLSAPVLCAGSTERTSFAEKNETKGFYILELGRRPGLPVRWQFKALPTRSMAVVRLNTTGKSALELEIEIKGQLSVLEPDAIVQVRPEGKLLPDARNALSEPTIRRTAPDTMNISVARIAERRGRVS